MSAPLKCRRLKRLKNRRPEKKKKPTAILAAVAAFILIAGGIGGYFLFKKAPSSEPGQPRLKLPRRLLPKKNPFLRRRRPPSGIKTRRDITRPKTLKTAA
jgi:hypothetical protein